MRNYRTVYVGTSTHRHSSLPSTLSVSISSPLRASGIGGQHTHSLMHTAQSLSATLSLCNTHTHTYTETHTHVLSPSLCLCVCVPVPGKVVLATGALADRLTQGCTGSTPTADAGASPCQNREKKLCCTESRYPERVPLNWGPTAAGSVSHPIGGDGCVALRMRKETVTIVRQTGRVVGYGLCKHSSIHTNTGTGRHNGTNASATVPLTHIHPLSVSQCLYIQPWVHASGWHVRRGERARGACQLWVAVG
jgi:hypothetical protein